jgi:hypothetical protein
MRVWYFSEMAYHPSWAEGLTRLRGFAPGKCDSGPGPVRYLFVKMGLF